MKLPVPDDWNGQAWRSICIEWPDSIAYRALLWGFLSYLTRGRAYDESTGTITAAQAVGAEIFRRNFPLRDCATGEPVPTPRVDLWPECGFGCGEDECEECGDMACITDVKIEDGKLWVMKGCCEWEEVGDIQGLVDELGEAPFEHIEPPAPPTYSGCGKAYALVETLYLVADSAWDHRLQLPWNFVRSVEQDAQLNLSDLWLVDLQAQAIIIDGLGLGTQLFDADVKATLLCKLSGWLNDDAGGLDEDTFNAFTRLIQAQVWGDFVDNTVASNYFAMAWFAIGKKNANNIAKLAATDTTQDCGCPEIDIFSDNIIWRATYEITRNDGDTPSFVRENAGKTMRRQWNTGDPSAFQALGFVLHFDCSVPLVTQLKVRMSGTNMLTTWHQGEGDPCPADERDEWAYPDLNADTVTPVEVGADLEIEYEWDAPGVDLNTITWTAPEDRACPRDADHRAYNGTFRLIELNGETI